MLRLFAFLLACCTIAGVGQSATLVPPVLVQKDIYRWPDPPVGKVVVLDAPTSTTFVLFIPEQTVYAADGGTTLTMHFHGAAWFMQQQHTLRGARHPLLVANAKEGDAVYETEIMKDGLMASLLSQTAVQLRAAGGPANAHAGNLELSGFSAGYAGVRGVLRLPEIEPMVSRVLLDDSLYVGDAPDSNPPDDRKPRAGADGIDPIMSFGRKAAAGDRTLLMEFSTTPSMRSVGPMDCARAIVAALGIPKNTVALDSIPAARATADYQLAWRADAGNAHFWCYGTDGRPIHLAHVRNQAEMWRALDGLTSVDAIPPAMPTRPITPDKLEGGESVALDFPTSGTVTLFIPAGYKAPADGAAEITVHFHGSTWFVIQEHLRRGLSEPLVACELGQGSTVYRAPFVDPAQFTRLLDSVAVELKKRGAPEETHIATVNLTSFSAGYGAVRELIKVPEHVALIKRIVLGDSSYGSLDETALAAGDRVVVAEHVEPWANFARLAMTGEKTLLMATSDIAPSGYAGTFEVARAVAESLGVQIVDVPADSSAAALSSLDYPLHTRADAGGFHWWSYGGNDAVVHMTLARHIAEDWMALDQHGDP